MWLDDSLDEAMTTKFSSTQCYFAVQWYCTYLYRYLPHTSMYYPIPTILAPTKSSAPGCMLE